MATIKKRKGKKGASYLIRCYCGYDINGQQIEHTSTWKPPANMTERQADKEANRQAFLFEERCRTGQVLDSSIRFSEYAERWFRERGELTLRPRTLHSYRSYMKRINAAIGHIKLDKLQPHHLSAFYANLSENDIRQDNHFISCADLSALLKNQGFTAQQFALHAGLGERTVRSALHGKSVSFSTAKKFSEALGYPIEKLFSPTKPSTPLDPETIRKYHRVISTILSTAVKQQIIFSNPCERVELPKPVRKDDPYLNETDAAKLLSLLQKAPMQYRTAIELLLYTGMRRSELCGLEWKDINFETGVIQIRRTSQYIPGRGVITDETKNYSSSRAIRASASVLSLLRSYRSWQLQQRLKIGDKWQEYDRLFTTWSGKPMHPDTLSGWFHNFIKNNGFTPIHIHSLRHTNATLLIAAGTNIPTVSSRLGHANPSTTTKIYTHAIQSADAAAAETLDDLLHPIKKKA